MGKRKYCRHGYAQNTRENKINDDVRTFWPKYWNETGSRNFGAWRPGLRSRKFLGGVGVGFFCPTPTPEVQPNHFLRHTPKLGIPVVIFSKFLLKQEFFAVHHNFHW